MSPSFDNGDVSVIICSHALERFDDVMRAVASIEAQSKPVGELIVVVDHNDALCIRLQEAVSGDVRVVANMRNRGLSGARNFGVEASRLPVLFFLDDDAVLGPHALADTLSQIQDGRTLGVGTRIVPSWDTAQPAWFPDEFLWVVGCTYVGLRRGEVRNLIGASMCIVRTAFERAGGFSEALGRSHSGLPLGNEETDFCIRARAKIPDGVFYYDDKPVAHHRVRAERTTWHYFLRRCYAEGLSKARLKDLSSTARLSSETDYTLHVLPRGVLSAIGQSIAARRPALALRAVAIIVGLAVTVAAYATASLRLRLRPRLEPAPSGHVGP